MRPQLNSQKIEWDRKYGEKLKAMRDKMRRPNINLYQNSSSTKKREQGGTSYSKRW